MNAYNADHPEVIKLRKMEKIWSARDSDVKEHVRLMKQIPESLKIKVPALPTPATRGECISAYGRLSGNFERRVSLLKVHRDAFYDRFSKALRRSQRRYEKLKSQHDFVQELDSLSRSDKNMFEVWRNSGTSESMSQSENVWRFFHEEMEHQNLFMFQTHVQEMLEGQTEELKRWFLMDYCGFGQHIYKQLTQNSVGFEFKRIKSQDRVNSTFLPPEIMHMIYAHCDLESCVVLRQVSSEWFDFFSHMEDTLESKLKTRNPWIKPGDGPELTSWKDCVLVFVARLNTWTPVDTIDDIEIPDTCAPRKTLVARELKGRLPDNFEHMFSHCDGNCDPLLCDLYHSLTKYRTPLGIDLKTNELTESPPSIGDEGVLFDDEYRAVIRYKNLTEIELPINISLDDVTSVSMGPTTILVRLEGGDVITIPRDNPTEPYCKTFHQPCEFHFEVHLHDSMIIRDDEVPSSKTEPPKTRRYKYNIYNRHAEELIEYSRGSESTPVASYNGLIWWFVQHTTLMPTFIDLLNPGKTYYKRSKGITGRYEFFNPFILQGSKSRDSSQFVFSSPSRQTGHHDVFDMATGVITAIEAPKGETEGRIIMGFIDGKFHPWFICPSDAKSLDQRMESEMQKRAESPD